MPPTHSELDRYHRAAVNPRVVASRVEAAMATTSNAAIAAGLEVGNMQRLGAWILPHLVRADALAASAQARYRRAGTAVFVAAALAVSAVAAQAVFAPDRGELAVAEVAFLLIALGGVVYARRGRVHQRWIAYRVLAERFRSSLYLALTDPDPTPDTSTVSVRPKTVDWVEEAFQQVWARRPQWKATQPTPNQLGEFVATSWLDPQIAYHEASARRYGRRHRRLSLGSYALFAITFVAASLHLAGIGDHHSDRPLDPAKVVVFLAIALPAGAAALAGLEAQRQDERNAERSDAMAEQLLAARDRLHQPLDMAGLRTVVHAVAALTFEENRDWIVTMRFQEIRPA